MSTFKWSVSGMEPSYSPGVMEHSFEDSGTVECELLGEVLIWLAEHGPFWGMVDSAEPVTFTIEPLG